MVIGIFTQIDYARIEKSPFTIYKKSTADVPWVQPISDLSGYCPVPTPLYR